MYTTFGASCDSIPSSSLQLPPLTINFFVSVIYREIRFDAHNERLLSLVTGMNKHWTFKQVDGTGSGLHVLEMKPFGDNLNKSWFFYENIINSE